MMSKGKQNNWKIFFYLRLLFSARGKVLNNFKIRLFPIKFLDKILTHEPTPEITKETKEPTKHKKSKLKLQQEFMYKNIADEKDINDEYCGSILSIRIHRF